MHPYPAPLPLRDQGDLKALTDLHMAAVESAQNGRLALARMFAGLIPGLPTGTPG